MPAKYQIRNAKMTCALHVPGQDRPVDIGSDWVDVDATTYQAMASEKALNRGFERRCLDNAQHKPTPLASAKADLRKAKDSNDGGE